MDKTLENIAARLIVMADEIRKGHRVEPEDLTTEARRLDAQAEMIAEGIVEWAQ